MPTAEQRLEQLERVTNAKKKIHVLRFQTDPPNEIKFGSEVITPAEYELRKLDPRYNIIEINHKVRGT